MRNNRPHPAPRRSDLGREGFLLLSFRLRVHRWRASALLRLRETRQDLSMPRAKDAENAEIRKELGQLCYQQDNAAHASPITRPIAPQKNLSQLQALRSLHPLRGKLQNSTVPGQRGFSLVLMLFLIVVVGLLLAAMSRINSSADASIAQEVLSTRALQAAESGIQAMGARLFPLNAPAAACPASLPLVLNFTTPGLNSCSVSVNCTSRVVLGQTRYAVEATGNCTVGNQSARRKLQVGMQTVTTP